MTPEQRSALIAIDASVVAITEAVRVLRASFYPTASAAC
jgi:hypothetical protein